MRTAVYDPRKSRLVQQPNLQSSVRKRLCPLCKQAGHPSNHFLSKCSFLPMEDKKYMARARQVLGTCDDEVAGEAFDAISFESDLVNSVNRVQIHQSPYLDVFCSHHPVHLTIDSGATGNLIRASTAVRIGANIVGSSQTAHQADGLSPLNVMGETRLVFT